MKILFVTNIFPRPGGPQDAIFLYWRAFELIKLGNKVDVLLWNQHPDSYKMKPYNVLDLEAPILNQDISVFPIHSYELFNPFKQKKIYKKIKRNYDLVHFHWLWSKQVLPSIDNYDIPYIITCHGSDIYRLCESFNDYFIGRLINKYALKYQINKLNKADHIMFVSEHIKNAAFEKGANCNNYSVISNGYNPIFNNNSDSNKKNKIIVGFCGLLIKRKRADKLIEIFDRINKKINVNKFIIIGEGELLSEMKSQSSYYNLTNKVEFTGKVSVEKVASLMKAMSVFLLPSREEAFGCVIKEAQASGVPVVGSSNGGIPYVIGKGGIVVDEGPNFEERYADSVVDILLNPISNDILKEEVKDFKWETTVNKEFEIYKNILEKYNKKTSC